MGRGAVYEEDGESLVGWVQPILLQFTQLFLVSFTFSLLSTLRWLLVAIYIHCSRWQCIYFLFKVTCVVDCIISTKIEFFFLFSNSEFTMDSKYIMAEILHLYIPLHFVPVYLSISLSIYFYPATYLCFLISFMPLPVVSVGLLQGPGGQAKPLMVLPAFS